MALAVVLTPQPATTSVLIQITGAAAGLVQITRSDANGVNTVRQRVDAITVGGALTVTDYEAALTGPVTYDVVDAANATTSASTTLAGAYAGTVIRGIQLPGLEAKPQNVTGYNSGRETASTVIEIIGRRDPVVVLHPSRLRRGTLTLWCASHDEAHDFEQAIMTAAVLMLRQPTHPGMDMWFVARSTDLRPSALAAAGWRWELAVEFVETRATGLPLLGAAGWTYDDVAALTSYATVRSQFDDYADLLVGP